jgi:NADP-dependent 3-hydroxy acid dehydrogenase YdfG
VGSFHTTLLFAGIGRATATAFLKEGAHVVLVGRNKSELESIAQQGPGFLVRSAVYFLLERSQ